MKVGEIMGLFEGRDEVLEHMDVVRHLASLLCTKLDGRFANQNGQEDAGSGYIKLTLSASEIELISWMASMLAVEASRLNDKVDAVYSALLDEADAAGSAEVAHAA